jgi:hypothetical protein
MASKDLPQLGGLTIPPTSDGLDAGGDELAIATDYLQQLQDRSIRGLVQWGHGAATGNWSATAEELDAVIEQVRAGLLDPSVGLGEVVSGYSVVIEDICRTLNLPLRGGVATGVVYQPRDVPAQSPVPGTNASVIVVPRHSLMLCHFVCKALAWAFPIEEQPTRYAISLKPKRVLKKLRRDRRLCSYLAQGIAFCATHDRACFSVHFEPLTGAPRILGHHLLTATEIFMIAHEYGHHIDEHRLGDVADVEGLDGDAAIIQELQADYVGALITAHFGARTEPKSSFAASAAGAIIALGAVDLAQRAHSLLSSGVDRVRASKTHPPTMVRMIAVDRLNRLYDPRERIAMRNMRRSTRRIMDSLWDLIKPELLQLRARGITPLPVGPDDDQWLPSLKFADLACSAQAASNNSVVSRGR